VQRARISRITSIGAAALLALGLLPGVASAALPTAVVTQGSLLAQYSAGNDAGFSGSLTNADTSTLSRLYLEIDTTGVGALTYIRATVNGAVVASACDQPGDPLPIDCQFRRVRPGDTVAVVVGVTPDGTLARAHYTWATTGFGSGGGDNSHGDTWEVRNADLSDFYSEASLSSDPNFAGGFNESSIQTEIAVSALNPQGARLANLPAAVPASVQDNIAEGSNPDSTCPETEPLCQGTFGDWVEVSVADGQVFGTVFQIQIVYYSGTPKAFVHRDSSGQLVEIGPCPKKNPASGAPCFTWSSRTDTATIYTFQNGNYKGR